MRLPRYCGIALDCSCKCCLVRRYDEFDDKTRVIQRGTQHIQLTCDTDVSFCVCPSVANFEPMSVNGIFVSNRWNQYAMAENGLQRLSDIGMPNIPFAKSKKACIVIYHLQWDDVSSSG